MEQTEILEGNKIIAEFMGVKFHPTVEQWKTSPGYFSKELEYLTNWNWLMPVIEKISKVQVIGATEQSDTCYPRTFGMLQNDTGLPMFRFNCCHLFVGATLIEAAWIAVVEFIKSENDFKNNNL